jgi:short-subunit dehydrogenase
LHEQDPAGELAKVALNVIAPLRLTRAALPSMVARDHGGVLTVSSIAAYWPQPHGTTYAATKAFLSSLGDTLACELAGTNVHVTTLVPGFTKRGNGVAKGGPKSFTLPEFAWLGREDVAAQGLAAVHAGVPICIPGATYQAALGLTRLLPRSVLRDLFRRVWGS